MQRTYQYSSLFTAGLLAPRMSIPESLQATESTRQDASSSTLPPPRPNDSKGTPEPIMVTIPTQTSSYRRASHRRRSSVTLQLSPIIAHRAPFKEVQEARERANRHLGSSPVLTIKPSSMAMAVYQPMSGCNRVETNSASRNQDSNDHKRISSRKSASLVNLRGYSANSKPKPPPTASLPALPTEGYMDISTTASSSL
ncbi:hypothetical protein FRC15_007771 [Serendipita sp. 397]|nr:hypothetical protein FRC15_007771 [Serendipita sp. 397]